ncbi:transmembrane channel-like protein 1 [Ceratitis capitata]|uniref:transmembrane channel-like protein 1 n=1 Tax=Ceratitis capitata TaxID=7213 RepID=UPI000329BC4F|nr:transmembrane channel-like protein 1 [Ceratitis capitata]
MSSFGKEKRNFMTEDNEDLDRIEVITTSTASSRTELFTQQDVSQNLLAIGNEQSYRIYVTAASDDNKSKKSDCGGSRDGTDEQCVDESIELITNLGALSDKRTTSPLSAMACSFNRGATPTNMVRRWSQTLARFDRDKNSIREKTIYRMPSRKYFEVDGNLHATNGLEAENEVELLAQEIEQHDGLMQDTALSHQHRLETLRALPQPLSTKRSLKRKLAISIEQHASEQHKCSWCHNMTNAFISFLLRTWRVIGVISHRVEIWYDDLKTIEGQFGCNVSSYFKFLRWLLMLNIVMLLCVLMFIIFPQLLYNTIATEVNLNQTSLVVGYSANRRDSASTLFLNLLTGEGYLQNSLLFYSGYSDATFRLHPSLSQYSLPHAYFMTMLVLYLFIFIIISTKMARVYRLSFIQAAGNGRGILAAKTICAWDYGISNRKAADLKHIAIFSELKAILNEKTVPKRTLTIWWRIWIFFSRAIAHMLVAAIIGGAGVGVWILLKELDSNDDVSGVRTLSTAGILNLTMLLMQSVLSWISRMEDYRSPRRTLHIALLRNFFLEAVIVSVLVYFLLTKPYSQCWETHIGQELYRFIVMDTFICLLIIPFFCVTRALLASLYWPWLGGPDFDISQKSLGLVYNQTLLWLGLLFAPLLVAIIVCKMFLKFYINNLLLMYLCKPSCHIWRSAQTHTLYLVFTFVSLLGVILTLGFIMTQLPMSSQCGPFRDSGYMFQIFIDGVLQLRENQTLWRLLTLLVRPAAVGLMLVIMSTLVYYLRAKSRARRLMVKLLKEMIYLEAKDKEFLLNRIMNITKNRDSSLVDARSIGRRRLHTTLQRPPVEVSIENEISGTNSSQPTARSDGFILRSRNT